MRALVTSFTLAGLCLAVSIFSGQAIALSASQPGDQCHEAITERSGNALEICTRGAEAGDALSQYNLALLYLDGNSPWTSPAAGQRWLRAAAEELPIAAYALGTLLIEANQSEDGRRWLQSAADQGVVDAQFDYATLLLEEGDAPSAALAAERAKSAAAYYRRAAIAGDTGARFNLSMLLLAAESPVHEPAEGLAWLYTIGALPDHRRVNSLIERYESQLPSETIEAARALLPNLGADGGAAPLSRRDSWQ